MKLDCQAMQVMAGCISRSEHVTIETFGVVEEELWCERCRSFSTARIALKGITATAVYDLGVVTVCAEHDGDDDTEDDLS